MEHFQTELHTEDKEKHSFTQKINTYTYYDNIQNRIKSGNNSKVLQTDELINEMEYHSAIKKE